LLDWPADFVLVETAPAMPVRVTAGSSGIAPLYLADDARSLHSSWDMADLRSYARGLCAREAARLLLYRPRYGGETLFTGIRRLTERATAFFGGALYLHYPEPALHCAPRELAPGAGVLSAFTAAMDEALDLRPWDPDATAMHLTGGFDSGVVAARAALRYPRRLHTAALLIAGPGRDQQIHRRGLLRSALPFSSRDVLVDCLREVPLHPDCARVRGEPISPYEEPLHHPFSRLTQALAAHGAHTVVTGLGGDEMVALSRAERPHQVLGELAGAPAWIGSAARAAGEYADEGAAPPAVVNSMTLLSLATTAPVLLRAGIWPVHPFTHPTMIRLGEQLPVDWRGLKQLQRRQLASLGLGTEVTQPQNRESFAEVVQHALTTCAQPLFTAMLREGSALFEDHLVDPDLLRSAVQRISNGRYREDSDAQLLQVIHLHLAAKAFGVDASPRAVPRSPDDRRRTSAPAPATPQRADP
jgi:Asparagine synthase